ncbi:MAG: hypothetical protein RL747_1620 [Bacteroidota bacterium]|jgi:hypothetical protein|nr:hypothetical protein [Bacteroidia bacterium]
MKYKFPFAVICCIALGAAACSNNPEGAFNEAEKNTQDSLDSLSNEAMFQDLYQDSSSKDSSTAKPGDVTTETLPSTPPDNTPLQAH